MCVIYVLYSDAAGMARDVKETLLAMCEKRVGKEQAGNTIAQWTLDKRVVFDVWR